METTFDFNRKPYTNIIVIGGNLFNKYKELKSNKKPKPKPKPRY